MIYLIITIILDLQLSAIINTAYQNLNYIFPNLLIISLPQAYNLVKNKKIIIISTVLIGIFYDTLYSDIFLLNTYFLTMYILLIYIFYDNKKATYLNVIALSFLGIIFYDSYIFFVLIFLNYATFKIDDLYYKIKHTILLNSIYLLLSILILKSRIFKIKKRKIKAKKHILKHSIF